MHLRFCQRETKQDRRESRVLDLVTQPILVHDDPRFVDNVGSIDGVDQFGSSLRTEERKNAGPTTNVEDRLPCEQILILKDEIAVGLSANFVLEHQLVDFYCS